MVKWWIGRGERHSTHTPARNWASKGTLGAPKTCSPRYGPKRSPSTRGRHSQSHATELARKAVEEGRQEAVRREPRALRSEVYSRPVNVQHEESYALPQRHRRSRKPAHMRQRHIWDAPGVRKLTQLQARICKTCLRCICLESSHQRT